MLVLPAIILSASLTHPSTTGIPSSSLYAPYNRKSNQKKKKPFIQSAIIKNSIQTNTLKMSTSIKKNHEIRRKKTEISSQHKENEIPKIREHREGKLTTPTLILCGCRSARKASVTPRIGSLGAGSTLRHQVDIVRLKEEEESRKEDRYVDILRRIAFAVAILIKISTSIVKRETVNVRRIAV